MIYKQNAKQQEEATDTDDGDDTSTIACDESEISVFDEIPVELLEPAASPKDDQKLEPIVEENPINDEAEENYDGAAGLWAQDFQLPCFKSQAAGIVHSTFARMETQRSAAASMNASSTDWFQVPAPVHVVQSVSVKPPAGSSFDDLFKLLDAAWVFTKERADCEICKRPLDVGRGVVFKKCLQTFCNRCVIYAFKNHDGTTMICPSRQVRCESEVRDEKLSRMNIFDLADLHGNYEFVENRKIFLCEICTRNIPPGDGIVLKNCLHQYCKPCLGRYIQNSPEVVVPCPFRSEDGDKCVGEIMDSELRSLVPVETYVDFLRKSLVQAEAENPNAYHCKTPNCIAWVEIDGDVDDFPCPTCKRVNCVKCKAVHEGITCVDYQELTHGDDRRARENAATEHQVRGLIASKTTQPCPRCGILVQRIEGCRHMTCTSCRHEFQWEI